MSERALFVDDEPHVISGLRRSLRNKLDFATATSGREALETMQSSGPFAVIVSDMRMPEMNGVELLAECRRRFPNTVRIMLTGNSDQQTAIDAVNEGDIFRFLNKPCPADKLLNAVHAGLEQYRLITAERDLLERTLRGAVETLAEVLALVSPEAFGRTMRLRGHVREIATQMQLDNAWELETLALVSQIGCVTIPGTLLRKITAGQNLTAEESAQYAGHAKVAADLLARIPRLEHIAECVRHQQCRYDGEGGGPAGDAIPVGARLLKVVTDFDRYEAAGMETGQALEALRARSNRYDPDMLAALSTIVEAETSMLAREIPIEQLTDNMVLAADVLNTNRVLILCKGQRVSESVRLRLQNFVRNGSVSGSVSVWVPATDSRHDRSSGVAA